MACSPKKAFVLAAGMGERMRPLTNDCPKPLLKIWGKTMLDRALDALAQAGVEEAVVNAHYLADKIEAHVQGRKEPKIRLSCEEKLLDTGGGVKNKLDFFGDEPFFVLNADIVWTDGATPALRRLAERWDGKRMDALLLLHPARDVPAYGGRGDYYLEEKSDRPVFWQQSDKPANTIFTGLRIIHPRLFDGAQDECFSFLHLFHKAEAAGRLGAVLHDGGWHHVGTPEALEDTNRLHLLSSVAS